MDGLVLLVGSNITLVTLPEITALMDLHAFLQNMDMSVTVHLEKQENFVKMVPCQKYKITLFLSNVHSFYNRYTICFRGSTFRYRLFRAKILYQLATSIFGFNWDMYWSRNTACFFERASSLLITNSKPINNVHISFSPWRCFRTPSTSTGWTEIRRCTRCEEWESASTRWMGKSKSWALRQKDIPLGEQQCCYFIS